jgi:hypothetical protein
MQRSGRTRRQARALNTQKSSGKYPMPIASAAYFSFACR